MNNFLLYLLKSTLCLSLFYLMFRTLMRKEHSFVLNRILVLTIVVFSAVIPLLNLPQVIQTPVKVELLPVFAPVETTEAAMPIVNNLNISEQSGEIVPVTEVVAQSGNVSFQQLLPYIYLAGLLITLLMLVYGLIRLYFLFRNAKTIKMEDYRLLLIEGEISAFSFGRFVVLSKSDYEEHRHAMLAHEQAHIRLNHFYDLLLLEVVKIFHWFNPVVYWLIQDLKEIHEFQADDFTLNKGIDATQYQLLIIQKCVGTQKFALANSFNHCQIKKRIVMMNKQKSSKARSWKAAAFLPLLALLLMAFGRKEENVMDFKDIQNPVNQKYEKKKSVMNGISIVQLSEYENIVDKAKDNKGVPDLSKISEVDKKRLETLYLSMNAEQKAAQIVIFLPAPPPLPKSTPTMEQMKIWEDSTIYGLWINGERANNSNLKNYKNTDFATFVISKLGKNTVNYGKHYFQVDLMTNENYANYLAQHRLTEKYFIALREKKEEKQSKSASDIEGKANLNAFSSLPPKLYVVDGIITDQRRAKYFMEVGVESVTILNGKDATDKYGENAKNGVFEITLKKGIVKESNKMATENIVKGKVTDRCGKPLADASVTVTGKTNEIFTDADGNFQLNSAEKSPISISFMGYKTLKIVPDFEKPLLIEMQPETVELDGIVAIAYFNSKTSLSGSSQNTITNKTISEVGEELPVFSAGDLALRKFIAKEIKYPILAQNEKKQGRVYVDFVVNKEGKVCNAKVIESVFPALDEEAIRAVNSIPKVKPELQRGRAVDVAYTIPITFKIQD